MIPDRWLLPEGVEEILPGEAVRLERLRRELLDLFAGWGYELVMPPFIEYLDSLLTGVGSDLDLQTFKLTDQLTGRLMGVRADMTPQVARIDAHHLHGDAPVRLCYIGTVLHALPDGLTRTRSPIQVGAELYGHAGIESDCEVLGLMLDALAVAGVTDVHLALGHVGIFRGLGRQAKLAEDEEIALYDALQRKAHAELADLLGELAGARAVAPMILALADLNGGDEVLGEARTALAGAADDVVEGVERLEKLAGELRSRIPDTPLHFDLAELRGYRYHTGVVFSALVPGRGQEVARGGRYDEIGRVFGQARPATGFSTDLKGLASLGTARADEDTGPGCILAPWSADRELLSRVGELRRAGERVVYELPEKSGGARPAGCDRVLRRRGEEWRVEEL